MCAVKTIAAGPSRAAVASALDNEVYLTTVLSSNYSEADGQLSTFQGRM